jgi:hypothetical protein
MGVPTPGRPIRPRRRNELQFPLFNVPVDASVTLTATVPGVGQVSQVTAPVAPNTVTQIGLPPTP